MARDPGLEELLRERLAGVGGLAEQSLFGGWAWSLDGNLLCGASNAGALFRLGKGNDLWALGIEGIAPMISGRRVMAGWVRVAPERLDDDALADRLIDAALTFVRLLPAK